MWFVSVFVFLVVMFARSVRPAATWARYLSIVNAALLGWMLAMLLYRVTAL